MSQPVITQRLRKTIPPTAKTAVISLSAVTTVGVFPMHRGHHAVWASRDYQADLCNMIDDLVARDHATGHLYRFPIVTERGKPEHIGLTELQHLIRLMDEYDRLTGNPWHHGNIQVRHALLTYASLRLTGAPPARNIFEPGFVTPALVSGRTPAAPDTMIARLIAERPESLVGADGNPVT
jgi:hypothetical protein